MCLPRQMQLWYNLLVNNQHGGGWRSILLAPGTEATKLVHPLRSPACDLRIARDFVRGRRWFLRLSPALWVRPSLGSRGPRSPPAVTYTPVCCGLHKPWIGCFGLHRSTPWSAASSSAPQITASSSTPWSTASSIFFLPRKPPRRRHAGLGQGARRRDSWRRDV